MNSIKEQIKKNFKALESALDIVLQEDSTSNALVVSGAAGVGKSYTIIKRLEKLHKEGTINYTYANNKVSSLGLYELFWNNRRKNRVILLDDVDVWKDEDMINLLKAVLETKSPKEKRTITYGSTSSYLADNEIPREFNFQGTVIFITNKNLRKIQDSKSILAEHVKAFTTRTLFVDLGIHDKESIIVHISTVMQNNILKDYGITDAENEQIKNFIVQNQNNINNPSLRTAVLIASVLKKFPNWEEVCLDLFK